MLQVAVKVSDNEPRLPLFFSVGGSAYTSMGKDSEAAPYRWLDVLMLALEPSASYPTGKDDRVRLYQGVGPILAYVHPGRADFDSFRKAGFKFAPVEAVFLKQGFSFAVNPRYYPDRFTDHELRPTRLDIDRSPEWALGFSIGLLRQ